MVNGSFISLLVSKALEYIQRDFEEDEVRVEVIGEPTKVFTVEGFIDLVRGAEYNLPRRIAYELEKKGIVKIKSDDKISLETLSRLVYNEESTIQKTQLVKTKPFFYSIIRKTINDLKEKLRHESSIELLEEYRNFLDLLHTAARIRTRKMLNALLLTEIPPDLIEKMSEEEKLLFVMLFDALKSWLKGLGLEKA